MATLDEKLSPLARILGEKGQNTLNKLTSFLGQSAEDANSKEISAKEKKVTEKDEEEVDTEVEGTEIDEQELAEMVEFVGAVVKEMVGPVFEEMNDKLDQAIAASTKETKDGQDLQKTVKEQAATIKELQSKLNKLNGDLPRHTLKTQRASQAEDTVVDEKDVEGAQPNLDPLSAIISKQILGIQ